jgi:hypothetical protein
MHPVVFSHNDREEQCIRRHKQSAYASSHCEHTNIHNNTRVTRPCIPTFVATGAPLLPPALTSHALPKSKLPCMLSLRVS